MVGSYDYRLVTLSVLISVLAAYAVRYLAERVIAARGGARLTWLLGGGEALARTAAFAWR
jgi:NO-binding membrane sensor protein with MHYT domain